jgi:rRNA maturation RNase YbeY
LAIFFFSENTDFILSKKQIYKNWIKSIIVSHDANCGNINVIFTDDNQILDINKKFLNHDYFTDIITFNYNQNSSISGDIYISVDTVKSNANKYSVTFIKELNRVIIHGILHLLGYNDHTEEEIIVMRNAEESSLSILNIPV